MKAYNNLPEKVQLHILCDCVNTCRSFMAEHAHVNMDDLRQMADGKHKYCHEAARRAAKFLMQDCQPTFLSTHFNMCACRRLLAFGRCKCMRSEQSMHGLTFDCVCVPQLPMPCCCTPANESALI